jgi:hypothetical protein
MVGVILVVFLTISLKKTNDIQESYEIEGFLQSMFEYTSNCSLSSTGYLSIDRLIQECGKNTICREGTFSCNVLNNTIEEMLAISWPTTVNSQFKAYEFKIFQGEIPNREVLTNISAGTLTNTSKGASQPLTGKTDVQLTVYY